MKIFIVMFYRQKLNQEYSQQFVTLFQQWEMDMQKIEEQEEKLAVSIMLNFIIYYNRASSGNGDLSHVVDLGHSAGFHFPYWLCVSVLLNGKPENSGTFVKAIGLCFLYRL